MTRIELHASKGNTCPNGRKTQEIEVRGLHERPIGLKAELTDGNTLYIHPQNYVHVTVIMHG